jgi:hypothetical protein
MTAFLMAGELVESLALLLVDSKVQMRVLESADLMANLLAGQQVELLEWM